MNTVCCCRQQCLARFRSIIGRKSECFPSPTSCMVWSFGFCFTELGYIPLMPPKMGGNFSTGELRPVTFQAPTGASVSKLAVGCRLLLFLPRSFFDDRWLFFYLIFSSFIMLMRQRRVPVCMPGSVPYIFRTSRNSVQQLRTSEVDVCWKWTLFLNSKPSCGEFLNT